jgi:nitrile hydratase accessory protein
LIAPEEPRIGPLARRDGQPAFAEPWQAEVLALAFALSESGMFSAAAWSETLGAELRRAEARGAPDDHETYYAAALAALERLVAAAGGIDAAALSARIEAWRRAYLATPHGQPVELAAATSPHR